MIGAWIGLVITTLLIGVLAWLLIHLYYNWELYDDNDLDT